MKIYDKEQTIIFTHIYTYFWRCKIINAIWNQPISNFIFKFYV